MGGFSTGIIKQSATRTANNYSYLDAGGEQDVLVVTPTSTIRLESISLDLTNMTQNGIIKLYSKINGADYEQVVSQAYTAGSGAVILQGLGTSGAFKVTYTEGADEGAARSIDYELVYLNLG